MIKKKFKDYASNLSQENFIQLYESELSKRQMIDVLLTQKKKILVSNFHFFADKPLKGTKEKIHYQLFPVFYNLQKELILEMLKDVDKKDIINFLLYFPEDQLERMIEEQIDRDIDNVIIKMAKVLNTAKQILEKRKNEKVLVEESNCLEILDIEDDEEITELSHGFKMFTIYDWDSNEWNGVKNDKDEVILSAEFDDIEVYSPTLIAAHRANPLEKEDDLGNLIEENWEIYEVHDSFVRQIKINRLLKSIKRIDEKGRIITAIDKNGEIIEFDFDGEQIEESNEFIDSVRVQRIFNTFWTNEEIDNYKKLGITKFSKWDIEINESNIELFGPSKALFQNIEQTPNKKHFFFDDFYLSFGKNHMKGVYIIGKDPDRNPNFNLEQE